MHMACMVAPLDGGQLAYGGQYTLGVDWKGGLEEWCETWNWIENRTAASVITRSFHDRFMEGIVSALPT